MKIKALYFDGLSPVEQDIEILWQEGRLRLIEANSEWNEADIKLEWIGEELHISHKSSLESLTLKDLSQAEKELLKLQSPVKTPSQKMVLALGLAVVTIGLFVSLYTSIRPVSYALARAIPSEKEHVLFDPLIPLSFLKESRCTQWDAQGMMQRLGNGLSEAHQSPPSVEILDWNMANAFAFPGRRIYVTQGLLDTLETSEQLLAVLAHEQGHVDLRHNLGEAIHGLLKAFAWSMAIGDFSGAFIVDPQFAKDISDASYSRTVESDADTFSSQKLIARGHDPKALGEALMLITEKAEEARRALDERYPAYAVKLIAFFEKIFSTHPESYARLTRMQELYPHASSREALSSDEWRFLKEACRSTAKKKDD